MQSLINKLIKLQVTHHSIFQIVDIYRPHSWNGKRATFTLLTYHTVTQVLFECILEARVACCELHSYPYPLNTNCTNNFQSHSHLIM